MVPSSSSKTKVILHGALRAVCPYEDLEFVGSSAIDILKALFTQVKEFAPKPGQLPFQVCAVGYSSVEDLYGPLKGNELHIVPDFRGGKQGAGFIKIALGVALIAAAFFTGGISLGALGSLSALDIAFAGASLLLGGLLEVLSPAPKLDFGGIGYERQGDPPPSKYLGAPKNTVAIGTRIPILVGEHIAYGHYISFDVQAVEA